jgi:hypothetical protein
MTEMVDEQSYEDPIDARRRENAAAQFGDRDRLRADAEARAKTAEPEKSSIRKDIDLIANYVFESSTDGRVPLTAEVVKAGARLFECLLLGLGAIPNDQRREYFTDDPKRQGLAPPLTTDPFPDPVPPSRLPSGELRAPQAGLHPTSAPQPFPMFERPTEPGARTGLHPEHGR